MAALSGLIPAFVAAIIIALLAVALGAGSKVKPKENDMNASALETQASAVYASMKNDWGAVRRFLSSRPLTGAWIALGVGAGLGYLAALVF